MTTWDRRDSRAGTRGGRSRPIRRTPGIALGALAVMLSAPLPAAAAPARSCVTFQLAGPESPLIQVPTRVNGHGPYQFVVDTGSTATLVSAEIARSLKLTLAPARGIGAGGAFTVHASRVRDVALGDQHRHNLVVGIAALPQLGKVAGHRIDGIIGYNFLSIYTVTIDYPHRRLCLQRGD